MVKYIKTLRKVKLLFDIFCQIFLFDSIIIPRMEVSNIMKHKNSRLYYSFIINILIIIMELFAFLVCYKESGFACFEYYTQDSNLFLMFTSLLYIISLLICDKKIPHFVSLLKYAATTSVVITFLTVVTILAPVMGGYKAMLLDGTMLIHHLICPIFAFVTFVFFEKHNLNGLKDALISMIFTCLYGVVAVTLNVLKIMDGPYPFLKVYDQTILMSIFWLILMMGSSYLITVLIGNLNHAYNNKK